jgi:hypothetical protein
MAVLVCYEIGELGVIQQYIINAKTATFLCKKWWNKHVPWLAIALAIWYNKGD